MALKPKASGGGGVETLSGAARLADLARRCRELSELTAVPEVAGELERIARALEDEAGLRETE